MDHFNRQARDLTVLDLGHRIRPIGLKKAMGETSDGQNKRWAKQAMGETSDGR
jgi:hypothetical protein